MGGIAGAAGSIGSSAIQAAAAQQMQSQMLDNYWKQVQRQAEIFRGTSAHRFNRYDRNYNNFITDFRKQRDLARMDLQQAMRREQKAYDDVLEEMRAPQSDVYGGQRKYVPGLGYQYSMAPGRQDDFDASISNMDRQIQFGNMVQEQMVPEALADYIGRERQTPEQLFQTYLTDANLADHRARTEMGEKLALASVRGGNRSNWSENVQDYLAEDSKDRQLRIAQARRAAIGDSLAFNAQSDNAAMNNLRNVIDLGGLGAAGSMYGMFGDAKQSNMSGMQAALSGAIGNVSPQTALYQALAGNRQPDPMNQSHTLKMWGDYEQPPSLSV